MPCFNIKFGINETSDTVTEGRGHGARLSHDPGKSWSMTRSLFLADRMYLQSLIFSTSKAARKLSGVVHVMMNRVILLCPLGRQAAVLKPHLPIRDGQLLTLLRCDRRCVICSAARLAMQYQI